MTNLPFTVSTGETCSNTGPDSGAGGGSLCWDLVAFANLPMPGPNGPIYTGGQIIWPPNLILPMCFEP